MLTDEHVDADVRTEGCGKAYVGGVDVYLQTVCLHEDRAMERAIDREVFELSSKRAIKSDRASE